jgi:hypothetical protein
MSSKSSNTSVGAVLEATDEQPEPTISQELQEALEVATASELGTGAINVDGDVEDSGGDATETRAIAGESARPSDDDGESGDPEEATEILAQQLAQLVHSVTVVEELSRRAREAATGDLAVYDSLEASQQQYADRLAQACAIRNQACQVHERAFGQEAKHAAEPVVVDAERVVHAFTELSRAWQQRASGFLEEHPDIQLLLAERQAQEEQRRTAEAIAARERRLLALVADCQEAARSGLLNDARRLVDRIEREFPDQTPTTDALRRQLEQRERAAKDDAARQALAACAEHQARGDLEGAVNILEQVDVHGLSVDVSQDVFGRWSDACSRLAQTAAATLLRFAPAQGRGLILYADPAYPNGLIVFSSLGMGPGYPQGKVVTDVAILRRARQCQRSSPDGRGFREAAPLPATSWGGFGVTESTSEVQAPVRH